MHIPSCHPALFEFSQPNKVPRMLMRSHSALALLAFLAGLATTAMGSLDQQVLRTGSVYSTPARINDRGQDLSVEVDLSWQILGPFPTGMREQDFGADPLEAFGGFRTLLYDIEAKYPSELAKHGIVGWHTTQTDSEGWVHVLYPNIDWKSNQQFMGWAFNQFQAWARTTFTIPAISCQHDSHHNGDGLCAVTIQCDNVGDLYINNERLSGDWYGYGLTRHTLRLEPDTKHTLSVRVVHEVRIFGGVTLPPPSKFKCELKVPFAGNEVIQGNSRLMVQQAKEGHGGVIIMDTVEGKLAGEFISVTLRNVGPEGVLVKSVRVAQGSDHIRAELKDSSDGVSLYPSTHRPIIIRLHSRKEHASHMEFTLDFELEIVGSEPSTANPVRGSLETDVIRIGQRSWGEVYKYTFLDFDGTVHYAAAIPPSDPSSQPAGSAPIVVALHGAGVEVEQSKFWLSEYKQRERAWIVLPTGRSPWGYDWHGTSVKNVMNAIQSIADTLPGVPDRLKNLPGIKPDPERLFMAGHSNGGQGTWYLVTHFPDYAIAATPAAGYVNIKQYVPFFGWLSNSYTDSHLRGLLESSIIEFDNDVHMSNTVGIPILARTGGADDNVPPFNSRKMVRLGQENAHNLSAICLSEIEGEGHWFPGVLHDETMQGFLKQHLQDDIASAPKGNVITVTHPPFPKTFEITLINPAGMGARGGIQIEQLRVPFRKGTIKVSILDDGSSVIWSLQTTNIRRFRFLDSPSLQLRRGHVSRLVVEGVVFKLGGVDGIALADVSSGTFVRDNMAKYGSQWQFIASQEWETAERHRETYGPAIQILEKRVIVVIGTRFGDASEGSKMSMAADRIAKLIAHDMYLYGRGDVEVITDVDYLVRLDRHSNEERINLVLIGDAHQNRLTKRVLAQRKQEVIIDTHEHRVHLQPKSDISTETVFDQPGTGLLMIRPWGPSNLAMVIAGVDAHGLEIAARLFPKRTGLLVPDWVVTGSEMPWKGAGGILAAGYWGNHWEYLPLMSA